MVITDEKKTAYYPAATFEGSNTAGTKSMINWEKNFFTLSDDKITNTSSISSWDASKDYVNNNGNPPYNSVASGTYPSDHTVTENATSQKLYTTNATTNKVDLGMAIKVMAGDRINIYGRSYYQTVTSTFDNTNSSTLLLANLFNALLGAPSGLAAAKGFNAASLENINSGATGLNSFIRGNDGSTDTKPKAYINYIFFDEQFKYAGGGASQVGANGTVLQHGGSGSALQGVEVPKNGYLFTYVSNESNVDVYFDNVQVIHTKGPILEETHYYPFGLTMAGISSKAVNRP